MSATKTFLPTFRADRFELGAEAEALDLLLPLRSNRTPAESERDPNLWALEGVLNPYASARDGHPRRVLLASNIPDVRVIEEGVEKDISGREIISMLASARLKRLSMEYPGMAIGMGGLRSLEPAEDSPQTYTERLKVAGGVSIAFAHTAYTENIGVVASAIKAGFNPPDLGSIAGFGADPGSIAAAA